VASATDNDVAIRLVRDEYNRFRGRMFQAVEAIGLPDKQERALKGLIRQLSYDGQAALEQTLRESFRSNGR
jgi:hypothetical protein